MTLATIFFSGPLGKRPRAALMAFQYDYEDRQARLDRGRQRSEMPGYRNYTGRSNGAGGPFAGYDGTRFVGSYVPADVYYQGQRAPELPADSLASRSNVNKTPAPDEMRYPLSLSSRDLMMPSIADWDASPNVPPEYERPRLARPNPFDDVAIDEPRDLTYVDTLMGDNVYVTRRFNQSHDLRGDIGQEYQGVPAGASLSTQGIYLRTEAWRGWVY
jgi:hypothetical protein